MDTLTFIKNIFKFNSSSYEDYICIYNKNNLKWILPRKNQYAQNLLKNWRPYSLKSFIFWQLLKFFYFFNVPHLLYNIKRIRLSQSHINWSIYGWKWEEKPFFGIYLGTKSLEQKIIIFLFDRNNFEKNLIIKYPFALHSWDLIKKEFKFLNYLKKNFYGVAPVPIKKSPKIKFSSQKFLKGKPTNPDFSLNHYQFLASLVYEDRNMKLKSLKLKLNEFILQNKENLSRNNLLKIAKNLISKLNKQGKFPLALIHGDFICWNIKENENGNLSVFDWEYSEKFGLPFYDLYYYKYQTLKKLGKNININLNQYINFLPIKKTDQMIKDLSIVSSVAKLIVLNNLNMKNFSERNYKFLLHK